jgi:hypothetical protein
MARRSATPPAVRARSAERQGCRLGDPRGAAQALRELLRARVEQVLARGQLDKDMADELVKIAAILEKLEGAGYDLKAAALEVGERLAGFAQAREADPARRAWLADLLESFYAHLANTAPAVPAAPAGEGEQD